MFSKIASGICGKLAAECRTPTGAADRREWHALRSAATCLPSQWRSKWANLQKPRASAASAHEGSSPLAAQALKATSGLGRPPPPRPRRTGLASKARSHAAVSMHFSSPMNSGMAKPWPNMPQLGGNAHTAVKSFPRDGIKGRAVWTPHTNCNAVIPSMPTASASAPFRSNAASTSREEPPAIAATTTGCMEPGTNIAAARGSSCRAARTAVASFARSASLMEPGKARSPGITGRGSEGGAREQGVRSNLSHDASDIIALIVNAIVD
mmetsp:Transcript_128628/g.372214  ORF Transcript_128628/g.372214 Transcript_128628/m.372214 type:complete len:267 (-) Transcript_128628:36-836(-)